MDEQQVKALIIQKFGSINAFSESIDIANSTVVSILERGFLNAKLKNVFAICKGLNINPEDLESGFKFNSPAVIHGDNNGIAGMTGNIEGGVTFTSTTQSEDSVKREKIVANNSDEDLYLQKILVEQFKAQLILQQQTIDLLAEILKELRK